MILFIKVNKIMFHYVLFCVNYILFNDLKSDKNLQGRIEKDIFS